LTRLIVVGNSRETVGFFWSVGHRLLVPTFIFDSNTTSPTTLCSSTMSKSLRATAAVLAVVSLNSVEAHSKMTKPNPNSLINNSPSGILDGPNTLKVPDGMSFQYGHEHNTAAF
jgi:hypothetical protein